MPSLTSRAMPLAIALLGRRRPSADDIRREIAALQAKPKPFAPPASLGRTLDIVATTSAAGWPVFTVTPRGATPSARVLYLHGGAYIREITRHHWKLVGQLASAGAAVTVPIYPVAPRGTAAHVVAASADLAELLAKHDEPLVIAGDSAGGGLALAVTLALRDRGADAPAHTALISPWLDATGSHPEILEIAPRDPWLHPSGLTVAADAYRGELDREHPWVSPLNGDPTGLGPITLFTGTRDILNVDAHRFRPLATAAGVRLDFHEEREMIHVYPLLPIPEGKKARTILCGLLAN
ncbi:steryl acetyl hydrolase [Prescottella agglutinans]|uniref:Steryl acetyl hydrolase n=1 Tax=Prescottella agglutinans TaxID=1644129 RepID=A0A438BGI1_9NOCA|nr:alpha/beta hydrolase [Prescottella agglutinans]RVW10084.1 steryl acetyl hydrolase [Prescottella agglutinans]